tara:strand:+ start:1929 stop:2963 length:1035 start_codon:yes stop_codon:yes gene_type:complete
MILIILFIILVIYLRNRNTEKFKNYKEISIQPTDAVINKLEINMTKNEINTHIFNQLSKIFPINNSNYFKKPRSVLTLTNKTNNHLCLVEENMYDQQKYTNIRYISCLAINYALLVSPLKKKLFRWSDFKDKIIGTSDFHSQSYQFLTKINTVLDNLFKIKIIKFEKSQIISAFNNNLIDGYFFIAPNPNKIIYEVNRFLPLRFIGTESINQDVLQITYPNLKSAKVDLDSYNIHGYTPKTLRIKSLLLCNKNLSHKTCFNMINTIFKNLVFLRENEDKVIRLNMKDLNPDDLYLSNYDFKLHDGVNKYYREIGLITNNPSSDCIYKIGADTCSLNKLNRYRLI